MKGDCLPRGVTGPWLFAGGGMVGKVAGQQGCRAGLAEDRLPAVMEIRVLSKELSVKLFGTSKMRSLSAPHRVRLAEERPSPTCALTDRDNSGGITLAETALDGVCHQLRVGGGGFFGRRPIEPVIFPLHPCGLHEAAERYAVLVKIVVAIGPGHPAGGKHEVQGLHDG